MLSLHYKAFPARGECLHVDGLRSFFLHIHVLHFIPVVKNNNKIKVVKNPNNKSTIFWLDIAVCLLWNGLVEKGSRVATFMHISMFAQCFAKTFFPSDSLALLDKGISFLAGAPPPVSPRLCNSCSVEPYPKRVMSAAFLFQSVFLEQMAKRELGRGPRARWGMCQFLQRKRSLGSGSRAFPLPSALSGASRTSQAALRTSGVWLWRGTGGAHELTCSAACLHTQPSCVQLCHSCSTATNNRIINLLNSPIRGKHTLCECHQRHVDIG